MLAVTGIGSTIVDELRGLLPEWEKIEAFDGIYCFGADRYLLCAGLLQPATLSEQSELLYERSLYVNLIRPLKICERVLEINEEARICLIGSESGFTWSHDDVYAAAKAAVHKYVETKKLLPKQQLIAIAPSIIEDSGMTQRRTDLDNLARRKAEHPKRRFLKALEVARLIHFCLYVDDGYLSGQVIRMNGGV